MMAMYLANKITAAEFCDEYYYCYDLELDRDSLNESERRAFSALGKVAGRFSDFESDHLLDSKAFTNEEQLRQKILETCQILGNVPE